MNCVVWLAVSDRVDLLFCGCVEMDALGMITRTCNDSRFLLSALSLTDAVIIIHLSPLTKSMGSKDSAAKMLPWVGQLFLYCGDNNKHLEVMESSFQLCYNTNLHVLLRKKK